MQRTNSLEKTLMLGKSEGGRRRGRRGWDGWMASPTQWTWVWVHSESWRLTGRPGVLQSTGSQGVGHDWATEPNWAEDAARTLPVLREAQRHLSGAQQLLALLGPSFHVRLRDIPSNNVISLWSSFSGGCCDKKPIPCENHCGTGNEWWCPRFEKSCCAQHTSR